MEALQQVSLATTLEAAEAVGIILERIFGQAPSVYQHPEQSGPVISIYPPAKQRITGAQRRQLAGELEALESCGVPVGDGELKVKPLGREDWVDSWKRHFKPLNIRGKILVRPDGIRAKAQPGQKLVVLNPGLSFGTGQHATTCYCLEQMVARRVRSPQSLLDVGTGSGILAIAAAKLGYVPVKAFDFDAVAVQVARDNAKRNRVPEKIRLSIGDINNMSRRPRVRYDMVCANLFHDLLKANAEVLIARVKPKGCLLLAGILEEQFDSLRDVFEATGMRLRHSKRQGEWRSGTFVHAG